MITKFESGKSYILKPEGYRYVQWNAQGQMDFLKDGKPHKCKEGNDFGASFYDCINDIDKIWYFIGSIEYFDEVPETINWRKRFKA